MEDRPPDDGELIARARHGELHAYEEIVRRHQTIAFRTAWVITGSAADAEEAAQDAFVKAQAALPRFRQGAPLRPWLLTIVANEARNRARSAGRRERLVLRAPRLRAARGAAGGARAPARDRPPGDRLPLLPRALRGRDGGRAGLRPRHGEVASLAGARAAAGRDGGEPCLSWSACCRRQGSAAPSPWR